MRIALVLGGGKTVYSDVTEARKLAAYQGIVGCNDIGAVWPEKFDAWVSFHENKFYQWSRKRKANPNRPDHELLVGEMDPHPRRRSDMPVHRTTFTFPGQTDSGSSGMFALKVAMIDLGFDKAVLCGIPMDAKSAHYFNDTPWAGAARHQIGWTEAYPEIKDRVRSMSGWTKQLLGEPTKEWLNE